MNSFYWVRHHVTGCIERGEKEAIVEQRALYVCWAVQYVREDGTDANRRDFYRHEDDAREVVRKCTEYKTARVRVIKFQEVQS